MTFVVVASFIVSVLCGAFAAYRLPAQEQADTADPATLRRERAKLFCIGFFGWPFAVAMLLTIVLFFWDILFLDEEIAERFDEHDRSE